MKIAILVLGTAALVASAAGAQDTARKPPKPAQQAGGSVPSGKNVAFRRVIMVYDPETQDGIAGAEVVDDITRNTVTTSSTGHFVLVPAFVKESGAVLEIRKLGYTAIAPLLVDPTAGGDTILVLPGRSDRC